MITPLLSILLFTSQIPGEAGAAQERAQDSCTVLTQGYLLALEATSGLQALEIAEHEAGVYNRTTSQRLTLARGGGERSRRLLSAQGCSGAAFVPAYSRYAPAARACAAVELGGEPGDDYRGCDPLTWRP